MPEYRQKGSKLKTNREDEMVGLLLDAVTCVQTRDEAELFLRDLCTVKEIFALTQRIAVAKLLREHATYQEITEKTGASTATISRVNRALSYGDGGYHTILARLEGNDHGSMGTGVK